MIGDIIKYYLFDYEIKVYPKYTKLDDQMIKYRMHHFWMFLTTSRYANHVKKIMATFYDEENTSGSKSGRYIVFDTYDMKEPVKFDKVPPIDKVIDKNDVAVFIPYYLFKNSMVDDISKQIKLKTTDRFDGYQALKKKDDVSFIYHKAFLLRHDEEWQAQINECLNKYKLKHGHDRAYQELWCIIVLKDQKTKPTEYELSQFSESFALTIKEWGLDILGKNIVKHASMAAMTAIDARNLSHNIGSHVLSLWNMELSNLLKDKKDLELKALPYSAIHGSKELLQYIQHRMDFIAEVATSTPCSEVTMDFKKDVIDVFCKQEILLEYIAKSENHCLTKDSIMFSCQNDELRRVSIPNGIIGTHAFYSILENFIRNAAKHYTGQFAEDFKILIEVKEANSELKDQFIEVILWDTRLGSCDRNVYNTLNKYISKSSDDGMFADEAGIMKSGGWGIKEMLVSANFLRKNPPDKLFAEDEFGEPAIMEVLCENSSTILCDINTSCCRDGSSSRCLGIRLYLRKSKDMCVVGLLPEHGVSHNQKFSVEFIQPPSRNQLEKDIPSRLLIVNKDIKWNPKNDPMAPMRIVSSELQDSFIDDNFYLDQYEYFIKQELNETRELPKICYTGGGKYLDNVTADNEQYIVNVDCPGDVSSTDGKSIICYYYHAEEKPNKDIVNSMLSNGQYLQPISGRFSSIIRLENLPSDDKYQKQYFLELIESALTNILIIDERISDLAKKDAFHGFKIGDILFNMGIYIVDIPKPKIDYSTMFNQYNIQLDKIRANKSAFQFMIIHQGILDKLEGDEKKSSKKLLDNIHCDWKIIDSGRGIPKELRALKYARFIEISAVLKMLECYDKHALVQTLFSLRRPIFNNN